MKSSLNRQVLGILVVGLAASVALAPQVSSQDGGQPFKANRKSRRAECSRKIVTGYPHYRRFDKKNNF